MFMLLAVLAAAITVSAQTAAQYENYVQITGHAERKVAPDKIYVSITVDNESGKGKLTVEQQERAMVKSLAKLGVDCEKKLTVENMNSNLQSYWWKKDKIATTKSYKLELNDAAVVGPVFAALAQLNISQVDITETERSDIEQIKNELRVEAVKNAKQIASTLAGALGQKIGRAVLIQDQTSYYVPRSANSGVVFTKLASFAQEADEETPALQFKDIELESNVSVKFVLE